MKKLLFITLLAAFTISTATSQKVEKSADPLKQNIPVTLLQQAGKNIPAPKLLDLKFTAANVTATLTGTDTYTLTITCSIKNDGTAAISMGNISIEGRLSNEVSIAKTQDISFTNHYTSACGTTAGLSYINLEPGASTTVSYSCFNMVISKTPRPVYVLLMNYYSPIPEVTKENNRAHIPIFL